MSERSPFDGRPFYCSQCHCGFGEFMACEMPDCALEPVAKARSRAKRRRQHAKRAAAKKRAKAIGR